MFGRRLASEVRTLFSSSMGFSDKVFTRDQVRGLPPPTQRYLQYCLKEGQRYIAFARLKHGGSFRMGEGKKWLPIVGEEYFTTDPPGFIWRGRVKPFPVIWITGRDRYYQGKGNMLIKLFSLVTVADSKGEEMDQSSLVRWVAEAPWFPTALISSRYLGWEPVDDSSAKVVASYEGIGCSAVFRFNAQGQITQLSTQDRFRDVDGRPVRTGWTGYYRQYRDWNGVKVPTEVEVVWNLPGGDFSYARFQVTEGDHDNPSKY
ncbi:MAG: hypothetical protein DRI40_02360 [Chloroflexi bacterium]|nr:MAG: hypothetical protein DRI40_02360 [Chloroflexota bacterium]